MIFSQDMNYSKMMSSNSFGESSSFSSIAPPAGQTFCTDVYGFQLRCFNVFKWSPYLKGWNVVILRNILYKMLYSHLWYPDDVSDLDITGWVVMKFGVNIYARHRIVITLVIS